MPPPLLPIAEWEKTKMTLHLYLQIVGKIRLKTMPRKNHWWNITLYVNSKGITTDVMPFGEDAFEIQFNFIEHRLEVYTCSGAYEFFSLHDGLSVAEFYRLLFETLNNLGIDVTIVHRPYSLPDNDPITTPFEELIAYDSYDPQKVHDFWQVLVWVDKIFKEFSGRFYGKTCPVHIYWHHLDIVVTRFSGRKVPLSPGMNAANKDAYSHEVISFGFWAGDENVPGAAFYSYTYPSPEGLENEPIAPASARWNVTSGSAMALLMYDDLLEENDPKEALLNFLESTYVAGAKLAGWNIEELTVPEVAAL
jgi:hypothetical protein